MKSHTVSSVPLPTSWREAGKIRIARWVGPSVSELNSTGGFQNGQLRETDLWLEAQEEDREGAATQNYSGLQGMRHPEPLRLSLAQREQKATHF